jgi:hypothetical protein
MSEIEFKTYIGEDVEVVVFFEIQPEEKQTRYYPGCPEEVVFNDITLMDGKSISDLLKQEVFDTLEIQCKEHANELAAAVYYGD